MAWEVFLRLGLMKHSSLWWRVTTKNTTLPPPNLTRPHPAQGAIVDLTAESEELEAELSRRGTLGIIKVYACCSSPCRGLFLCRQRTRLESCFAPFPSQGMNDGIVL